MSLNFSSGIEYYLNVVTNVCEPLGLDYWNSWCYGGANQSETYVSTVTIGGTPMNVWGNGQFEFVATDASNGCIPSFLVRGADGMSRTRKDTHLRPHTPSLSHSLSLFGGRPSPLCAGDVTVYDNYDVGPVNPSVFVPPPNCHLALDKAMAKGRPLARSPRADAHPAMAAALH
jgi:hypothetical protein